MSLDNYKTLLKKVDEKFKAIHSAHSSQMQCKRGCSQCCVSGLSVFEVEAENISRHLKTHPEILKKLESETQAQGSCNFLTSEGACAVYEVRPVICRSQGAPLKIKDSDSATPLDACPLNFENTNLEDLLNSQDFFDLNHLNTLLVLINQQFTEKKDNNAKRISLTSLTDSTKK